MPQPEWPPAPCQAAGWRAPARLAPSPRYGQQLLACANEFERLQEENEILSAELKRLRQDWNIEDEKIDWLQLKADVPAARARDAGGLSAKLKKNKIACSREAVPARSSLYDGARLRDFIAASAFATSPLEEKATASGSWGREETVSLEWNALRSTIRADAEEFLLKIERRLADLYGTWMNSGSRHRCGAGCEGAGREEPSTVDQSPQSVPLCGTYDGAQEAPPEVEKPLNVQFKSEPTLEQSFCEKEARAQTTQNLQVTIIGCTDLRNADLAPFEGQSDPFCTCSIVNKPASEVRTHTVQDTLNPMWNYTGTLFNYSPGDSLIFYVMDKDTFTPEDLLGEVTLDASQIEQEGGFEGELELTNAGAGYRPRLRIRIRRVGDQVFNMKPGEQLRVGMFAHQSAKMRAETKEALRVYLGDHAESVMRWWTWYEQLEEPERTGRIATIVNSSKFEAFCMLAVVGNAIFMGYATNYQMANLDARLTAFMVVVEALFLLTYSVEITLKAVVHGRFLILGKDPWWNVFDVLVVILSSCMMIEELHMRHHSTSSRSVGTNITFLRAVRMFKLARIMRIFKHIGSISELRMMLDILIGCLPSLLWSIILLVFITYIFGLLFVQAATGFLQSDGNADEDKEVVLRAGMQSVQDSMITLYEVASGGMDWGEHYDRIRIIGGTWGFAYLFYIAFFNIAVWNVITSIFIDRTMKLAKPDLDSLMYEQSRKVQQDAEELLSLIQQIDEDQSGMITYQEFLKFMEDDRFKYYFLCRGLDIYDAVTFFQMLESNCPGHAGVDIVSFVKGCMHNKGNASSIDLHMLHFECKQMHTQLIQMQSDLGKQGSGVQKLQALYLESSARPAGPVNPPLVPPLKLQGLDPCPGGGRANVCS